MTHFRKDWSSWRTACLLGGDDGDDVDDVDDIFECDDCTTRALKTSDGDWIVLGD